MQCKTESTLVELHYIIGIVWVPYLFLNNLEAKAVMFVCAPRAVQLKVVQIFSSNFQEL